MLYIFTDENGVELHMVDQAWIETVQVGDYAPSGMGALERIKRITARGVSSVGNRPYICYYTEFGPNSTMSNSLYAYELNRSPWVTRYYNSAQCDVLESLCQCAIMPEAV